MKASSTISSRAATWRNACVGNSRPVGLLDFIAAIERATGRQATYTMLPMQPGDVPRTWADTTLLQALTGFRPQTEVQHGIDAFVAWYREYNGL